ncbi:MAG: right-handed parallel beta-helix repeat-containing protein, partial [Rhodospirillales bacterium]|nr:right-handed parallel beta-helix repeat-containing protein [Rhodospirillales bacterium]
SVHLYGVGQRVTHNRMYDGPHNAILLHGNDHLIEFNEFHHLAIETNDAAAIYMGRNPSEQGNLIRHNFFHHIGAYSPWGTSAVYVDDGACGTHLVGNVFYRCGYAGQVAMAAFFNNGGRDHLVEGNLFIDCPIAVGIMLSTLQDWQDFLRGTRKGMEYLRKWLYEDVDIRSETYLSRYPALRHIAEDFGVNTIRRNLLVRCGKAVTPEERQTLEHNVMVAEDPGFADEARMDFTLSAQAEAARAIPGFTPPPLRQMGLYLDEHRRRLPARTLVDSRLDVLERPVVSRPGEEVTVKVALRVANLSTHPVSARLHLWSKPDGSVVAADDAPIALDLQPGQVV